MSGLLLRLSRRSPARRRWWMLPTVPNALAVKAAAVSFDHSSSLLQVHQSKCRYLSSQFDITTTNNHDDDHYHEELETTVVQQYQQETNSTSRDNNNNNNNTDAASASGTMNRDKIRELRYFILQHCQKNNPNGADAAQNLLTRLVDESILQGRPLVNIGVHNRCLDAWAKCGKRFGYLKASSLLEEMWKRHETHPDICPAPNSISYGSVLDACAQSSTHQKGNNNPQAATKAEEWIKDMEQRVLDNPNGDIQPTTRCYNSVIAAHANLSYDTYGAANSAEDWLRYLSKSNIDGGPGPDTRTFNIVLKAWKVCPENKGADRALELLQLMIKLFDDGFHDQVSPDPFSFGSVIQAFADRDRPDEAEDVLRMALSFYLDHEDVRDKLPRGVVIDLRACFNMAINGWAKSQQEEAPERADALLFDMKTLAQETELIVARPDIYTYTSSMEAMANSGREDAPEMVESKLYSLVEQCRHHQRRRGSGGVGYDHQQRNDVHPPPIPSAASFDCVIRCWYRSQKVNRAERMEALLNTSLDLAQQQRDNNLLPQPRTVNMCLKAWCQAGHITDRAIPLLNRMEMVRCVNSGSYVPLILDLLDQAKQNHYDAETVRAASIVLEKYQTQVNHLGLIRWHDSLRHHYLEVLKALGKVGTPEAADWAYLILEAMESNRIKRAKPTTQVYTSVILVLARTPNKVFTRRALNIFDHMMKLHYDETSKVQLDTFAFVALLTYLANTKQEWAAAHADSVLQTLEQMHMESRNDDKTLQPDYRCYDKCIQARAKCGDLSGAVNKLKRFVDDYREARSLAVPSEIGIDVVHRCCIRDGSDEAARLAQEVLDIKEQLRNEGNLREKKIQEV